MLAPNLLVLVLLFAFCAIILCSCVGFPSDSTQSQEANVQPVDQTNITYNLDKPRRKFVTNTELGKNGRFGNQMFQIAATLGFGQDIGAPVAFPKWKYEEFFHVGKHVDFEDNPEFDKIAATSEKEPYTFTKDLSSFQKVNIHGYRQHVGYFTNVVREIRLSFVFSEELLAKASPYVSKDAIGMHVRRGDYVNHPVHDICDLAYYNAAVSHFQKLHPSSEVLIISDDAKWCREKFPEFKVCETGSEMVDFAVLSLCRFKVIPNSTFSWWSCWLDNRYDSEVILPTPWIRTHVLSEDQLYPREWHIFDLKTRQLTPSKCKFRRISAIASSTLSEECAQMFTRVYSQVLIFYDGGIAEFLETAKNVTDEYFIWLSDDVHVLRGIEFEPFKQAVLCGENGVEHGSMFRTEFWKNINVSQDQEVSMEQVLTALCSDHFITYNTHCPTEFSCKRAEFGSKTYAAVLKLAVGPTLTVNKLDIGTILNNIAVIGEAGFSCWTQAPEFSNIHGVCTTPFEMSVPNWNYGIQWANYDHDVRDLLQFKTKHETLPMLGYYDDVDSETIQNVSNLLNVPNCRKFSDVTSMEEFREFNSCKFKIVSNFTSWFGAWLDNSIESQTFYANEETSPDIRIRIGGYYQCYKQELAFVKTCQTFREVYPNQSLVIVSDNGNDYRKYADEYHATYWQNKNRSGNGITNQLTSTSLARLFITNFLKGARLMKEKYFVLLEDDVRVMRPVAIHNPSHDIIGNNTPGAAFPENVARYLKTHGFRVTDFQGCGGSLFRTDFWKNIPDDEVLHAQIVQFGKLTGDQYHSDQLLPFLCLLRSGTIANGQDLYSTEFSDRKSRDGVFSTAILHQFKVYYENNKATNFVTRSYTK